ncbi:hypothetical protein V2J09_020727, partial [Rumex salicifolius]
NLQHQPKPITLTGEEATARAPELWRDGVLETFQPSRFNLSFSEISMMNFAASLSKRVNIRELLHEVPVYSGATDASVGGFGLMIRRWATKKTGGSTKNGRDSNPKYLGVKKFGGERVIPGNIIVRQRGTRFHPGDYVGIGKDHTLFALKEGKVKFETHKLSGRKWVHVEPLDGHVVHPLYTSCAAGATRMNVAKVGALKKQGLDYQCNLRLFCRWRRKVK